MTLENTHPAIADLRHAARRRLPRFAWEYLDSATGTESSMHRNRAALDDVLFDPAILSAEFTPDLSAQLMGRDYPLPVGIAPVGMSGMIWPGAEPHLAKLGAARGVPYCLSTVATQTPETIGPMVGDQGWFQLYPPRDPDLVKDMLKRARDAGFHTMVLTADVPVPSRRERQRRAQLTMPPKITLRMLWQTAQRPAWAIGTLRHGMPRMRTLETYTQPATAAGSTEHIGYQIRVAPDWDYLRTLRDLWDGALVVKGVMTAEETVKLVNEGVDAVWVSNHGGRQFDGARASLDALRDIRGAVGEHYPLIYDGSVSGGLDVMRAIAVGADFVMLGRAFHFGLAAFGARGAEHVLDILRDDMSANMGQLGTRRLKDIKGRMRPA